VTASVVVSVTASSDVSSVAGSVVPVFSCDCVLSAEERIISPPSPGFLLHPAANIMPITRKKTIYEAFFIPILFIIISSNGCV
jgi:hypothetical protein